MDFSDLMPRDMHPMLIWLGKKDWLSISQTKATLKLSNLSIQPGHERYAQVISEFSNLSLIHLLQLDAYAVAIANGPKLFMPTVEQFDSMRYVDIKLPISAYAQPYPSMIVKIPVECRNKLAIESDIDPKLCPSYAVMYLRKTEEGKNLIFLACKFLTPSNNDFIEVHYFQDREDYETVEDALSKCSDVGLYPEVSKEKTHIFVKFLTRSCMNLMLMIMHYGHKDAVPLDKKAYEKHRKKKMDNFSCADFLAIEMKQNVVIRQIQKTRHDEPTTPTGIEMPSHWRRGHWANQRWGTGNQYTKLILRPPVLVRADRVVGDIAESEVAYNVKS